MRADQPGARVPPALADHPAPELDRTLGLDQPSDVRRVARAAAVQHLLPKLVEPTTEGIHLRVGQTT